VKTFRGITGINSLLISVPVECKGWLSRLDRFNLWVVCGNIWRRGWVSVWACPEASQNRQAGNRTAVLARPCRILVAIAKYFHNRKRKAKRVKDLLQVGYNAGASELYELLLLQGVLAIYDQDCWLEVLWKATVMMVPKAVATACVSTCRHLSRWSSHQALEFLDWSSRVSTKPEWKILQIKSWRLKIKHVNMMYRYRTDIIVRVFHFNIVC